MADETKDNNQTTDDLTPYDTLTAGTYVDGVLHQTPAQKAAAGPQAEPKTVKMGILRDGSFNGTYYHAGESAEVP